MSEEAKTIKPKKVLTAEQTWAKKQYYRDYYQRKKRENGIVTSEKRGRPANPDKKPKPITITRLAKPMTLHFE